MIRYLLDINLLMALAWPSHVHHDPAQEWFKRKGRKGWASCPLTQTGFVRISSNPKFIDGAVTPKEAIALMRHVTQSTRHQFWADDLPITDQTILPHSHLVGHRQVTDAYLLGLAKKNRGKLATFDSGISALLPDVVQHKEYLEILEA